MTILDRGTHTVGSKNKIHAQDTLRAFLCLLFVRELVAVQDNTTKSNYSLPLLSRHLLLTTKITERTANHGVQFQLFLPEPLWCEVLWILV